MERREFIKKAAVAAAGGALWGCAKGAEGPSVQANPRVEWRLASSFPRALDTIFGSAEVLSRELEKMSDGRFTVRTYEAGELVPGLQVMDAIQQGTAEVGQTASYYFIGKNPALAFDSCVPFGLTARQQGAWLHEGGGLELMRELFDDFNIVNFPAGNTGAQMGGWFKRKLSGLADLKGLKMRIPGMGGEVMDKLGVTVQVLAGGDIYPALERGAIDATEWVGPYDDEKLGFYKIAKFYYYPGWWEPGPSLSFFVNKDAWKRLPIHYQEMFTAAASTAETAMQARYDAKNPPALLRLRNEGVELVPFSGDIMDAALEATKGILEDAAGRDPRYAKVYDQWRAFRETSFKWFATAELAYADYAFKHI